MTAYPPGSFGHVPDAPAGYERLRADYDMAWSVLRSLARSKVIGLDPDGSVWVFGGMPAEGSLNYTHGGATAVAPVWRETERYATADSPMAHFLAGLLLTDVGARDE